MKIRSLLITLTLLLVASNVTAQDMVVIGGAKFAIHDVVKGETLYSLARQYNTTVDDIKAHNDILVNGLKAGQRIKIPVNEVAQPRTEHTTATATTPASAIATVADTAQERVANESLSATESPEPNDDTPLSEVQEEVKLVQFSALKEGDKAEVALLLPLGSVERPAQNYLDLYRGFLIGLDSVRMSGYSVNVNLYNTAHDHHRIEEIISSGILDKMNLVVGPVYEDELIPVVTALQGKNIPIVSPLANLTHTTSSAVFQMSPAPNTKLNKVEGLFDGSKRVVIISTDNIDNEFDSEVRSMIKDTSRIVEHKYIYEHPSIIEKREKEREKMREEGLEVDDTPSPSDMSPLLQSDEESIIVITANNEIEVDRILAAIASANIALTARSQRVAPFVIFGNNRWNRYRNIDRAILFTNNVTLLSTYHARRSEPVIKAFDKRFVEEFGSLPSLYAYRGYDAAMVFVKALYGTIETGLEGVHSMPLLTPYTFDINEANGIRTNSQWIKVNYNSNFTITTE